MMVSWSHIPLGEIAPAKGNPGPLNDEEVWNLSLEDIESQTGKILSRTTCAVSALGSAKCCFDSRHVLYSKLRPYLNKVVVPDSGGVGTSELIPLLPDAGRIDRNYLAYYLRSPEFLAFAKANTRGANLPRISMEDFWRHKVPVAPTLTEQHRIVTRIKECMERVEEIEKLGRETRLETDQLAPALYESIESKNEWPAKRVGEIILGSRNGRSISRDNANPSGHVLSLSAVRDVTLDIEEKKPIQLPADIARQFPVLVGDVFISRSNTRELVGLASVAETSTNALIYPDLLIKLAVDPTQVRPRFLAYALRTRSCRKQIQSRAVGTSQSMVKISAERLKGVEVRVPPLASQDELLGELDDAHKLIVGMQAELTNKDTTFLRDAILRKAFAGEL